mmetsp:Transcript_16062/g.36890  ORF Transcript_16062/g.36890 Transcript_16062/m.36890 type:complete len:129 (-) Transcript_16062:65-451(-)
MQRKTLKEGTHGESDEAGQERRVWKQGTGDEFAGAGLVRTMGSAHDEAPGVGFAWVDSAWVGLFGVGAVCVDSEGSRYAWVGLVQSESALVAFDEDVVGWVRVEKIWGSSVELPLEMMVPVEAMWFVE